MDLALEARDHTTLSRRSKHLKMNLPLAKSKRAVHLIKDSTGLPIVGEGEWAAAKHGGGGKRGWRKLHIGVDRAGRTLAQILTSSSVGDSGTGVRIMKALKDKLSSVTGDDACDSRAIYESAHARVARV